MELSREVRLAVVEQRPSHREAARRFGIERRTVKKMLSYSAPPGHRRSKLLRRPKLAAVTGIIDAILAADREVPRKQRQTAQRIFERLRLRGLSGAQDDLLLAATVRNPRRLAKLVGIPPSRRSATA